MARSFTVAVAAAFALSCNGFSVVPMGSSFTGKAVVAPATASSDNTMQMFLNFGGKKPAAKSAPAAKVMVY